MRLGTAILIYLAIGLLVAAGVVGDETSFFTGIESLEQAIELLLAIVLWPLVLLGVSMDVGSMDRGSAGGSRGGGG